MSSEQRQKLVAARKDDRQTDSAKLAVAILKPWPLFHRFLLVGIYSDGNGFLVIGDDLLVGDAD